MAGFLRLVRRIAGVLLLFVFLSYQNEMHTDASGVRKETKVGAWFSPWYTRTEMTRSTPPVADGTGATSTSESADTTVTFTMASWSWPILAASLALIFWPSRKPKV